MRHRLKDIDNAHGGGTALPMALSYVRRELPQLLGGRQPGDGTIGDHVES